jgi:hypothetical protein
MTDWPTVQMKETQSFKMLDTTDPLTQHHIQEDLNPLTHINQFHFTQLLCIKSGLTNTILVIRK